MPISFLFLLSVILLPIQNFGLDVGLMNLKISQVFFLVYFFLILKNRWIQIGKLQKIETWLLFFLVSFLFISSADALSLKKSIVLSFAVVLCSVFFVCACNYINSEENSLDKLKASLYWSCSIYSFYGVIQLVLFFSGHDANVNFEAWDVIPRVPYFSSENVHAAFSLLTLSLLYSDIIFKKNSRNIVFILTFILNFAGLVATGSRGAMLAFFITAIFQTLFALLTSRVNLKFFLFTAFSTGFLVWFFWDTLFLRFDSLASGSDGTTEVRVEHYKVMYDFFIKRPFLGLGLDGSHFLGYQDVHNVFLMVLYEGGIFAFSSFVLLMIVPFLYFLLRKKMFSQEVDVSVGLIFAFFSVLIQACFEPSLYFYHLYLSLVLLTIGVERARVNDNIV